jgi:hypothetical protein
MKAERATSLMFGFLLFSMTEASWFAVAGLTGMESRWVLVMTPSILLALLIHFCGAAAFAVLAVPRIRGFVAFIGGVAMAVVLAFFAVVGQDSFWPFVLAIDAVMLAPPLIVGFFVGARFRRWTHHAA